MRPTPILALLALLSMAGCSRAGDPPSLALPDGALRVQVAQMVDRQGFEKPMPALTMLVPAGWRTQGDVEWKVGAGCQRPYQPRLEAVAPDGLGAIVLAPGEGWGANSFGPVGQGCPQAPHADAQQYLQAWVQRHRPGAQWLDYRLRPDRSREGQRTDFPGGGQMRSRVETGQALIGYEVQGRPVREALAVSISFFQSTIPMVGRAPMQTVMGESFGVLAWRAPAGTLDLRQFDAVWQTLRAEPEWKSRIDAGMAQMARENAETQAKIAQIRRDMNAETMAHIRRRGEIMANTRAEVSAIYSGIHRDRSASQDRMHADTVRTIREVDVYRGSSGPAVELPHHYKNHWKLNDGSYVLTDSATFDPGRDLGVQGERLQLAR